MTYLFAGLTITTRRHRSLHSCFCKCLHESINIFHIVQNISDELNQKVYPPFPQFRKFADNVALRESPRGIDAHQNFLWALNDNINFCTQSSSSHVISTIVHHRMMGINSLSLMPAHVSLWPSAESVKQTRSSGVSQDEESMFAMP